MTSRAEWVAKAAEALRGHVLSNSFNGHGGPTPATCLCGEVISTEIFSSWVTEAAVHQAHLAEALADALLPEVAETVQWATISSGGITQLSEQGLADCRALGEPLMHRTVTAFAPNVGAWKVAEACEVAPGIAGSAETASSTSAGKETPQIEETAACDNCDRPATRIVGSFAQCLACNDHAEELDER